MSQLMLQPLLEATWQTIYMVFLSSFFSILLGLALGVVLFQTRRGELWANLSINRIVGFIANVVRSVPFIILMITLIPLTRLLVGSSIGTNAAIVSLTIAAMPFYARIAESSLQEVPKSLVETAVSMGASTWQIIYKVLIPEALPGLIKGATLTVISLIGYSAMAGAIGGGGLGELAIQFGYQRFNMIVMVETVVVLVILVQIVQWFGDTLAKHRKLTSAAIISVILWVACITTIAINANTMIQPKTIRLGIIGGPETKIMQVAQKVALRDFGIHLKLIEFDSYELPNLALSNGDIDANLFQDVPFLKAQEKARGFQLAVIGKTYVYPMGLYSRKIKHLSQLKFGAVVAIPNDPSNEGRALRLLQKARLIRLKSSAGLFGTPNDVIWNPKNLQIKLLNAAQLPRVFDDAQLVALNNNFVAPAGFKPSDALFQEGAKAPYANIIVVREQDQHNPLLKTLVKIIHSRPVVSAVMRLFPNGAAIPAWR